MARRRGQETAVVGVLVVPPELLPITSRERREAHLAGRAYPLGAVQDRSRALATWFRERGVLRSDYALCNEAVRRGREQLSDPATPTRRPTRAQRSQKE